MINDLKIFNKLRQKLKKINIKVKLIMRKYDEAEDQVGIMLTNWPADLDILKFAQAFYKDAQNWNGYLDIFARVERIHPNKLLIARNFGSALLSLFRYEEAISKFLFCIANWDLDKKYESALANTYARLAISYANIGEWDFAKRYLSEAEKITPWDPDVIYCSLLLYLGNGEISKLQEYFDDQIKNYPKLYSLYYWRAVHTQHFLHDTVGSLMWYKLALKGINYLELNKKFAPYFFSTVRYSAPADVLKRSIEVYLQSNHLLKVYWIIFWKKIISLDHEINIKALLIYIDILRNSSHIAERKCQGMIKRRLKKGELAEFWTLLALAQVNLKKYDEALVSINNALSFNPVSYDALKILGKVQFYKEDWYSALLTFQKTTKICRFNLEDWNYLASCYVEIGDRNSVQKIYEQIVKLGPCEADTWVDLGLIYEELEYCDLALSAFKRSLDFSWLDNKKRQIAIQAINRLELT